jgi:nucleoside-diphosphate-sugar epimerase
MARIFITGSADGLGRAAAQTLLGEGHEVIVHARSAERRAAVNDLIGRGASAVVGDLADLDQTRGVAEQVNRLGRVDAVIHNAGIYSGPQILRVNIVAPYLLTALIDRPQRLVYLSSGMHHGGRADLAGLDWSGQAPDRLVLRQQAVCHHTRCRCCPDLARRVQQRRRPGLGTHQHGRTRRSRQPPAGAPDPRMARHQ